MNPIWKVYKSKVMKTLNPDLEEYTEEEVNNAEIDMSPVQEDDGPNAVSQLAKRMQGAGAKGWNRMSALFNKEDEHQLLEETESPPVPDHPLAVMPEEPQRPARPSGFWGSFATNWKQMAASKQAEAAANEAGTMEEGQEAVGEGGGEGGGGESYQGESAEGEQSQDGGGGSNTSFSKYAMLGGGSENTPFKWNFVTGKLAELKTKSMAGQQD
ncbi:uncharacterized protein C1orf232 [Coregonus clupeaformis]|uniref:uncharacterized protein C1orf232 n=1 Tax=Coregonus clupeaformis TaxID=59861 RepID=UPI001E1C43D5|nr:uncharacterized protein C1orf232 [Coregonus clupeaformis]